MRLAAVDIGTNSVKLLVADRTAAGLREVLTRVSVTRLGEGFGRSGRLRMSAMDRTLDAVSRFRCIALRKNAQRVLAVGTEALRRAENVTDFKLRCEYETKLIPRILSVREEARLSFLGGTSGLGPDPLAAVDIGGGSTEVMFGLDGVLNRWRSLRLGVVPLTERFLKRDPPGVLSIRKMLEVAKKRFRRLRRSHGLKKLVAIGGTAATAVSIIMKKQRTSSTRIHGRRFKRDAAFKILNWLRTKPLQSRKRVPGLEPARADVILAGLAILTAAAERLGFDVIQASARGLRHGVLLDQ